MNLVKLSAILLAAITTMNLSAQLNSQDFAFVKMEESVAPKDIKSAPVAINSTSTISDIRYHLNYKIDYPASMRPYNIEGVSTVQVTISKNGTIDRFEIIESLGAAFDIEIKNTLSQVKKVSPVLFDGVPTKQTIVFPIQFRL